MIPVLSTQPRQEAGPGTAVSPLAASLCEEGSPPSWFGTLGGPDAQPSGSRELPARPDLGALCQNHSAAAAPGPGRGPRLIPTALSPAPGGRWQVPSFLPSPSPGLGGTRLPTLPSPAFILPSGLVAESCCCARCGPHSGLVSLEGAEVRWYSRNSSFTIASCLLCFNPK